MRNRQRIRNIFSRSKSTIKGNKDLHAQKLNQ